MGRSARCRGWAVGLLLIASGCGLQLSGLDTAATDGGATDAGGRRTGPDATRTTGSSSSGGSSGAPGEDGSSAGDAADSDDGSEASADDAATGDDADASDAEPEGDAEEAGEDGAVGDDSSAPMPDAGPGLDATPPSDAGGAVPEGGNPCAGSGSACVVVPGGWTLVAFASSQATACPAGFGDTTNLVENPSGANACGCGTCSTTTPPTCNAGTVGVTYDVALSVDVGTCDDVGTPPALANSPAGGCGTDLDTEADYEELDLQFKAPPASGGVCGAPGVPGTLTFGAYDRSCAPASAAAANCAGGACSPTLAPPYQACITPESAGVVACPAGALGVQHVVGTAASFSCSACPCTVSGTCSAGTLTLYPNADCGHTGTAFTTGDCTNVALSTTSSSFGSYRFRGGTASAITCAATPGVAEDVTLTNETTICCAD
jgi:hypothetical protein